MHMDREIITVKVRVLFNLQDGNTVTDLTKCYLIEKTKLILKKINLKELKWLYEDALAKDHELFHGLIMVLVHVNKKDSELD